MDEEKGSFSRPASYRPTPLPLPVRDGSNHYLTAEGIAASQTHSTLPLEGERGGGLDWKLDILKEQVLTSVARLNEQSGIRHIRRHLAASPLFKGIPDFRQTRIKMLRAETVEELFDIMEYTRGLLNSGKTWNETENMEEMETTEVNGRNGKDNENGL